MSCIVSGTVPCAIGVTAGLNHNFRAAAWEVDRWNPDCYDFAGLICSTSHSTRRGSVIASNHPADFATAGPAADIARRGPDGDADHDRNLKLQYLAGLGLNLYQSDRIYANMLQYPYRFPTNIFSGSDATMQSLNDAMRRSNDWPRELGSKVQHAVGCARDRRGGRFRLFRGRQWSRHRKRRRSSLGILGSPFNRGSLGGSGKRRPLSRLVTLRPSAVLLADRLH